MKCFLLCKAPVANGDLYAATVFDLQQTVRRRFLSWGHERPGDDPGHRRSTREDTGEPQAALFGSDANTYENEREATRARPSTRRLLLIRAWGPSTVLIVL